MSIFTYKKDIKELKGKINYLEKSVTAPPTQDTIISYSVPLYNFKKKSDIRLALDTVPELSSIINYLANSFSVGEYHIKKNGEDVESKIMNILLNPNPLQSESEFKQSFLENLIGFGVCYIFTNGSGLPEFTKSLSILESDKTCAYVGDISFTKLLESDSLSKIIKHFEYEHNYKKIIIPTENVLIVTMNTDVTLEDKKLHYKSPLRPLEKALMVTPAMYDSMQNLMNNGGMKGFVSNQSTDSGSFVPIEEDEKKEIQRAFKNYGSKSGQNDIAFANNNLNYVPITSRIRDMLLPEQQNMIKTIIADVMGFDIAILNSNNANKYKSTDYQEARKSMYQEKLIPAANSLTRSLTKYFFKYTSEEIILDYSQIDVFSEDEKTKAEKISIESAYIINLNASVFRGEMTSENAIELLMLNGYDEESAKIIINETERVNKISAE